MGVKPLSCIKPYFVKETAKLLKAQKFCLLVYSFPTWKQHDKLEVLRSTDKLAKDGATESNCLSTCVNVLGEDGSYVRRKSSHPTKANVKSTRRYEGDLRKRLSSWRLNSKSSFVKICSKKSCAFCKDKHRLMVLWKAADGKNTRLRKAATEHDSPKTHCGNSVTRKYSSKAAAVPTLDGLLWAKRSRMYRLGASATVAIMEEAKARLGVTDTKKEAKEDPSGY